MFVVVIHMKIVNMRGQDHLGCDMAWYTMQEKAECFSHINEQTGLISSKIVSVDVYK